MSKRGRRMERRESDRDWREALDETGIPEWPLTEEQGPRLDTWDVQANVHNSKQDRTGNPFLHCRQCGSEDVDVRVEEETRRIGRRGRPIPPATSGTAALGANLRWLVNGRRTETVHRKIATCGKCGYSWIMFIR